MVTEAQGREKHGMPYTGGIEVAGRKHPVGILGQYRSRLQFTFHAMAYSVERHPFPCSSVDSMGIIRSMPYSKAPAGDLFPYLPESHSPAAGVR
jgi:hypothetical protein